MRIKDIHIDGFGVWSGLAVDGLPDTMSVFYGPNEAGKTTLMQFVRAVLYGFTPDRRKRYLPPLHGGNPGGALRITGPGGGYEVHRRALITDSTAVGALTINGNDGLTQGQHRLNVLLGQVDEAIFTNVFAIGLRELQELNTLDDTAAADELYKLSSGLDRVSLVEVLRRLRKARENLVGVDPDDPADGRIAELLLQRDRLRTEVEDLSRRGKRWAELAAQRRAQTSEIETLRQRVDEWRHESKTAELAVNLRDTWRRRNRLLADIDKTGRGLELSDAAPTKLKDLQQKIQERRGQLEDLKSRRRQLRAEADSQPVSRRLIELQPKIDAANQQAPWIEEAQTQLQRIEAQVEQAKKGLIEEAERAGLSEDDRLRLMDSPESMDLPELSRQSLSALAGPARTVREHAFQIKQAHAEGTEAKREADRLGERIRHAMRGLNTADLTEAIRGQGELISNFRRRSQLEEHLERMRRQVRELERDAVDLTTDQALPLDRWILLAAPFFGGLALVIYGLCHLFDITYFVSTPDSTWGTVISFLGLVLLGFYYMGRKLADRGTDSDLDDCDRQLDIARKQLRELERDRGELEVSLPQLTGANLETRLRETEEKLIELESLLPTYHSQQAALSRYKAARQRHSQTVEALKGAKGQWRKTLHSMGLAETLSPNAVKQIGRGYESLHAARRRLQALQSERDQRRRELSGLAQRIESLYRLAFSEQHAERLETATPKTEPAGKTAAKSTATKTNPGKGPLQPVASLHDSQRNGPKLTPVRADRDQPLAQLQHLNEEIARQQHWIDRRKELRDADQQLKKQILVAQRHLDRYEQMRRSFLARCGVENEQGFQELVQRKDRLAELTAEHHEVDQQIRTAIGQTTPYDEVARQLDSSKAEELESRWESLNERISQTEKRISQLLSRQGELAQEMRQQSHDSRLSLAQLELASVEQQLQGCVRHWQMLATTSQMLDEVCKTFEKERQPETLREASSFLSQLTDGKYVRIWTPLGTNALKVENSKKEALPIEVLSRGTREAVFIALRLALASGYARRGVMLPLVLDDVLVNFDRTRAVHAAKTLKLFADLGHQVMMFTCHQHIVNIFHEIGVQVRQLPEQGHPGTATLLNAPRFVDESEYEDELLDEVETVIEPSRIPEPVVVPPPVPVPVVEIVREPEPVPEVVKVARPAPTLVPERDVVYVETPVRPSRKVVEYIEEPQPTGAIDWKWYEEGPPVDGWFDDEDPTPAEVLETWWNRQPSAT